MSNILNFEKILLHTKKPYVEKAPASPFVKWVGGKRSLIPSLAKHFPEHIGTYWEPFVGGGAVFFTFADRIDRAILSDVNEELIITYKIVKSNVESIIDALKIHEQHHPDKDYYLDVRKQEPSEAIEIAARFIYLNKTCFNGLYRVNKSGKFNVPQGKYNNPLICNTEGLRAAAKVLQKATIRLGSFEKIVRPGSGDLIYCDPPYDECFTEYQAGGFKSADQNKLRKTTDAWVHIGANVIISNSDTSFIRKLYKRGGGGII